MQFRRSVTHVAGLICYLCTRTIPRCGLTCIDAEKPRAGIIRRTEATARRIRSASYVARRIARPSWAAVERLADQCTRDHAEQIVVVLRSAKPARRVAAVEGDLEVRAGLSVVVRVQVGLPKLVDLATCIDGCISVAPSQSTRIKCRASGSSSPDRLPYPRTPSATRPRPRRTRRAGGLSAALHFRP